MDRRTFCMAILREPWMWLWIMCSRVEWRLEYLWERAWEASVQ